jgi:hypothetical protein
LSIHFQALLLLEYRPQALQFLGASALFTLLSCIFFNKKNKQSIQVVFIWYGLLLEVISAKDRRRADTPLWPLGQIHALCSKRTDFSCFFFFFKSKSALALLSAYTCIICLLIAGKHSIFSHCCLSSLSVFFCRIWVSHVLL